MVGAIVGILAGKLVLREGATVTRLGTLVGVRAGDLEAGVGFFTGDPVIILILSGWTNDSPSGKSRAAEVVSVSRTEAELGAASEVPRDKTSSA